MSGPVFSGVTGGIGVYPAGTHPLAGLSGVASLSPLAYISGGVPELFIGERLTAKESYIWGPRSDPLTTPKSPAIRPASTRYPL